MGLSRFVPEGIRHSPTRHFPCDDCGFPAGAASKPFLTPADGRAARQVDCKEDPLMTDSSTLQTGSATAEYDQTATGGDAGASSQQRQGQQQSPLSQVSQWL